MRIQPIKGVHCIATATTIATTAAIATAIASAISITIATATQMSGGNALQIDAPTSSSVDRVTERLSCFLERAVRPHFCIN
ncbi:MAG: hypothetical protein ACXWET_03225 [Halobacteriota archaeon]